MAINIDKGRYWDLPWSLVSGCTHCSPGCDHCWSAAMTHRFADRIIRQTGEPLIDSSGNFTGCIATHTDRLDIPLKRRKSTVYAVWNDLFHEDVPDEFRFQTYEVMACGPEQHTYLILSKRPHIMAAFWDKHRGGAEEVRNVWHGLTVCNQQEADEKIPVFLQAPGKKFLSLEPLLGPVDLHLARSDRRVHILEKSKSFPYVQHSGKYSNLIGCVILGGETGPGARPMHPDWVRSIRDQCSAAGVPFFFKHWGEWVHYIQYSFGVGLPCLSAVKAENELYRVGRKAAGRLLDGRTHDALPWVKG